jgi:hypothetical protein
LKQKATSTLPNRNPPFELRPEKGDFASTKARSAMPVIDNNAINVCALQIERRTTKDAWPHGLPVLPLSFVQLLGANFRVAQPRSRLIAT